MRVLIIAFSLALLLTGCGAPTQERPIESTEVGTQESQSAIEKEPDPAESDMSDADKYKRIGLQNYISLNSVYTLSYCDVLERDDGSFLVTIGHQILTLQMKKVLDELDLFVAHETSVLAAAAKEKDADIGLATIGVSDSEDKPILVWITEDLKSGILTDYRGPEEVSYQDVSLESIREFIYPEDHE